MKTGALTFVLAWTAAVLTIHVFAATPLPGDAVPPIAAMAIGIIGIELIEDAVQTAQQTLNNTSTAGDS